MKVITALNNIFINDILSKNYEDINVVFKDLQYQEAVIELIEKEKIDTLILSDLLPGENNIKDFILKILDIDENIDIIIIVNEITKEYKKFLNSNGIIKIFENNQLEIEGLVEAIRNNSNFNTDKLEKKIAQLEELLDEKVDKKVEKIIKIEKQEIVAFAGISSTGKSDIITQISILLAERTTSKVLLFDLDTFQSSIEQYFGISDKQDNSKFFIDFDKKNSLNYMIDAINRKKLDINNFEEYIVKDDKLSNLDVLTGNSSFYECKENLNEKYYKTILDLAKEKYQYIFIDTNNSIFLDSTQFAMINATKIFFVIEGNVINIKRSLEILDIFINVWKIDINKIKIIVNKYSSESLEKEFIEEVFGGYEIITYIPFNNNHLLYLNKKIPLVKRCTNKDKKSFIKILEQFDYVKKKNFKDFLEYLKKLN